ncbi:MAG: peptidoglycan DD-metalloendopeptidase family protein [Sphingomonas sp.]
MTGRSFARIAPLAATGLLAGCIPSAAPPPGYGGSTRYAAPPPPARSQPVPSREQVRQARSAAPAWETNPVTPEAHQVGGRSYVVQPGDTLRRVAEKTGAGALAIAAANRIPEPYTIGVGQRLTIPGGRYHTVERGDTGIGIARAYGVPWTEIVDANGLSEPYTLRAGWRLLIPGGGATGRAPSTAAERAAAFHLDVEDLVTGSEPAIADNKEPARPTPSPHRVLASTTPVQTPSRLVGGFSWPVEGPVISPFGPGAAGVRNDGIQIAVPEGTPVRAAADGVVAYVGSSIPSLGGLIIIKHGDGYTTVYGNTKKLLVQRGQSVKRGQEIALSGETGAVTQPSLHFEIRRGRDPVDPLGKLSGTS